MPEFEILGEKTDWSETVNTLGGACFVKPVNEGSSLGMRSANSGESLQEAYEYAASFDSVVMAEARIVGREFSVALLNGVALPAIELSAANEFYDYDAKYCSDKTQYFCPCDLPPSDRAALEALAVDAFELLGCRHWGRVDFMQDQDGRFFLLEANTIPGMTDHSLVPMAAKAAGMSFDELLLEILEGTRQA